MCGQEGAFGTNSFQVYLDMNEMQKVDEAVKYDSMTQQERIESMYIKKPATDECDTNNLIIQNNVNNMKTVDGGGDDDYNPGF